MIIKKAFAPKLRNKILSKWGKLKEKDIDSIEGRFNLLPEIIQRIYNYTSEKANNECNHFKQVNKIR
jgi:hypothetical protein